MALNNMGLGFIFTARDAASAKFGRVSSSFGALDQRVAAGTASIKANLGKLKVAFGAFVVGAAALAGAFAIANPAGKFDQEIAKVGAISRASAADLKLLEGAALDAGLATQFSPKEAADGLGNLAAQGYNAQESMAALIPSLDLAAGGQISVAEATASTAAALKIFGLEVDQAGVTTDKLLRISNVTALQAKDLSLALGTVARGAGAAKQSIDEMLPSVGLVKNTGVDASVAASSVSSALLFMAKNADKFKKLGVNVADAQGRFRPFMDVVLDTEKALEGMTDTKRVKTATELYGRFGLTAANAISGQLAKGVRNAKGELLQGADAVDFLRKSMQNAGGAAAEFREKLLGNFEGQKTLLKGSLQTLAITIGQPFAQVLKPLVSGLVTLINGLIKLIKAIPAPIKKFAAGLFVAVAGILALVAGGMVLKIVFGFVVVAVKAAIAAFMALMAAAWPVLLVIGLVVGAVLALRWAIKNNLGGIGDAFDRMWKRTKLAWQAVTQLIRDGAFSGAVLEELNKVENAGIKEFAKSIFGIFHRIKRFFEGLAGAFNETVKPAIDGISDAFKFLVDEVGGLVAEISGPAADGVRSFATTSSDSFHTFGAVVGSVFGAVARVVGFVFEVFVRFFGAIAWGLKKLAQGFKWMFRSLTSLGEAIGDWAFDTVQGVKQAFSGAAEAIRGFFRPIVEFFDKVRQKIMSGLLKLRDSMIRMARKIPSWLRTEGMDRFAALDTTEEEAERARNAQQFQTFVSSLPAAEQEKIRRAEAEVQGAGLRDLMQKQVELMKVVAEAQGKAIVVAIDGEKVAEANQRATQGAADRGFSPVPVY